MNKIRIQSTHLHNNSRKKKYTANKFTVYELDFKAYSIQDCHLRSLAVKQTNKQTKIKHLGKFV